MKLPRRSFLHLTAGVAVVVMLFVAWSDHLVWSQTQKPIRIVVPFPPGGAADVLARVLGQYLSENGGQSVTVENRPGAGTIVGTEAVSRASPDGATLLV